MTSTSLTAEQLRARVHGNALTAATYKRRGDGGSGGAKRKETAPASTPSASPYGPGFSDEQLAHSSVGKGWNESKVKRDTDPGEEGQFDFKDNSKKKGGGGGKGGKGKGGKGKDPKKAAEAAAKKAASEIEKKASAARAAERKRASERKAAEARARRTKPRPVEDIQRDMDAAISEMRAEESARGLKPGQDYPGKMEQQKKVTLLRLELQDAQLGEDAPIAERIALRERNLAKLRSGEDEQTPPELIQLLEDDLAAFKDKEAEVGGSQAERKAKAAEAEKKKAAATAKRNNTPLSDTQRRAYLARQGLQSSGKNWNADARKEAAVRGQALPDGSYPIVSKADWFKARQALGRASNRAAVIRHLKKRAKALGIPESELDGVT